MLFFINVILTKKNHILFNLGNNTPVTVNRTIRLIETILNKKAKKIYLPMQPGDVKNTYADIDESKKELNFLPSTDLKVGLERFINWFRSYKK